MKRLLVLLSLLALIGIAIVPVLAQDCEDEIACVVVGPDDPIVIGTILAESGPNALLGEDSAGGIEIAVLQRDGMLLGRDIEIISEDDQCVAEGGQAAAQRIAADDTILGVIGTNCSGAAGGAMPILSEAGMLMISPSNTSPFLTSDDPDIGIYSPGYYRTAHNDLFQGALAAQFAVQVLEAGKLATIHDGDPYTDGLQGAMADTFAELGGEVVFQGAVSKGDTDMSAILTEIAANPPDVLYYPLFQPESDFITLQAKQTPGLENTILMTADGSQTSAFLESVGDAAIGMYQSGPALSGEAYDEFLALWDEEIGGKPPSGFHAHAYDATNILLDGIEAVAVEGDDGSVSIGRQALREYVTNLTDYEGLTGILSCQNESPFIGDCATGEALAIYAITEDFIGSDWPNTDAIVWTPADAE